MNNNSKYQIEVAAVDKFSKPLEVISTKQKQFKNEMSATRAESKKFSQAQRDIKSFEKVKHDIEGTRQSIVKLKNALAESHQEMKQKGSKVTATFKRNMGAQKKQLNKLIERYDAQQNRLNALKGALTSVSIDADNLSLSQRLMAYKTDKANKRLKEQEHQIKRVARVEQYLETRRKRHFEQEKQRSFKLKKLEQELQKARGRRNDNAIDVAKTAAYVATGATVIREAANLESGMVEVAKKAKFKSTDGRELSDKEQSVKLLTLKNWVTTQAPNLGMSPVELANIVASGAGANVVRAGREQEDLETFSSLAAKMSVAFDELTPEEAGKSVATWMSSMKLDMSQASELASAINHLSDNSAANTTAVTDVMTRSGSIMKSAGLDYKQSAALSASILAANGNKSEMAATAAKNMALTLTQGNAMSSSQKSTVRQLGLDPVQLSKDMQTDSVGTIYSLIEKIQSKPKYQRNSIVSTLFGRESIGGINPLITNINELKRVMTASSDKVALKISLEKEFAEVEGTTDFQIKRLKNSFKSITGAIGEELLPTIEAGASVLGDAMLAGTKFIQESEILVPVIINAAAALAVLKASTVAWRVASAALEVTSIKRQLSEAKLSTSTTRTTASASRAAVAIDRLNASLGRTAIGGTMGLGGDLGDKGNRRNKLKGLRRIGGKLPVIGTVATVGLGAYGLNEVLSSDSKKKGEEAGELVGAIGGTIAGAAAGAALFSVVPVVGTLLGGILGAVAGEEIFSEFGKTVGSRFDETPKPVTTAAQVYKHNLENPDLKRAYIEPYGTKGIRSSNAINQQQKQEIKLDYRPQITVSSSEDVPLVDKALRESEKRFKDEMTGLVSFSDHLPSYE